jgi:hypothetical protein
MRWQRSRAADVHLIIGGSCPRLVMRGLDPRIHRKKRLIQEDGLPGQARQ